MDLAAVAQAEAALVAEGSVVEAPAEEEKAPEAAAEETAAAASAGLAAGEWEAGFGGGGVGGGGGEVARVPVDLVEAATGAVPWATEAATCRKAACRCPGRTTPRCPRWCSNAGRHRRTGRASRART